jgi:hypothetical protein
MHKFLAAFAIFSSLFASLAVPAVASRILIPLHKQGSVLLVDDRRQTPNIAFPGIPGVHGLASDGKSLAVAVTDGTGGSRQPEIVLLDIRQPGLIATIALPGAGGHVAVSPDSKFAAIVHPDLRSVSIVNLGERKLIATLSIDGTPLRRLISAANTGSAAPRSSSGKPGLVEWMSPMPAN